MKKVLLAFTLFFTTVALAQDDLSEWIQMLKQDHRAQKKELSTKGMQTLTDEEA